MSAPSSVKTTPPRVSWLAALALACITLAAYATSFSGAFVYDDVLAIVENPSIRHLRPLTDVLWPNLPGGLTVSGRPLLNLSFALNYAVSGTATWSYHAVNLAIHLGATLLLFGNVRRTLAAGGHAAALSIAFAIALLWSLHPLQTESVTYIVQRAEALVGFCFLLALYAFVRGWLITCIVATLAAVATKEVAVTLPLIILLYDRTFLAGSFTAAWRARRGVYLALGATWLVLAALIVSGGSRGGTMNFASLAAWPAYWATQGHAILRYLALSVWPHPLVFDYGTFWAHLLSDWLPQTALVFALLVATAIGLWKRPGAGFCGAWFFLILAPTSLSPGTIQMIVEHRMYLPLAGVLTLLVIGAEKQLGRCGILATVVAALAAGAMTFHRNANYDDPVALWQDTVAKAPGNARAQGNLAAALAHAGRFDAAVRPATEAVRLEPDNAMYRYDLGLALADARRWADAVQEYERALQLAPDEPATHNNLAVALVHLGRPAEALPHYAAAARLKPEDAGFRYNLGVALLRVDRVRDAIREFRAVTRLRPDHIDASYNLGVALAQVGEDQQAVEVLDATLKLRPDDGQTQRALASAHRQLGNALVAANRLADAAQQYEAAVRYAANDPEAHHNLGVVYARQQRWASARAEFEAALRLQPDYAEARRHLDQLRSAVH